jgi:RHS repeat-associated protein
MRSHRAILSLFFIVFLVPFATFGAITQVTTFAGSGGAFSQPCGLAVTSAGDLVMADRDHHQIKRVSPAGSVTVLAGSGTLGDLDGAASVAQFKSPVAVAYDAQRDLIYVADTQTDSIRRIDGSGNVSTFAATGFADPAGLTVDVSGNLFVADSGNNRIKKITPSGTVTTVAGTGQVGTIDGSALQAKFNQPNGLAMTPTGALYIADQKNHLIRKLENGIVSTVAGNGSNGWVDGPALSAKFREPRGIAFDADGNLVIADSNNSVIRLLTLGPNPTVSTIAGNGNAGYTDGPPATAKFREPYGIVVAGAVFVADADNNVIRALYGSPTLVSIVPPSGPQLGGNIVHLTGTGFVVGQTQVTFGTAAGTSITVNSQTDLVVTVPASVSGPVDVTVTTPGGTATLTAAYTYLAQPAIATIQPAKGPASGATPVTITGTGFLAGGTIATIGGVAATAVVVTGTMQINATTPAGAPGLADVDVMTSGGTSVLHNGYRYVAAPVITSFTPTAGGTGTVVTITGQNFDPDPSGDQVRLNGVAVALSAASATQLTFTVPSGASTGKISVTTAGGTATSAANFTTAVVVALEITAPVTTFAAGDSVPFNAIARMTDGTATDVSSQATWTSSNISVVSVGATGLTTGHNAGAATVNAAYGGFAASKNVQITTTSIPTITPSAVDRTVVQPVADMIRFLYTGPNPVQTGVAANVIDDRRAATLRGTVHDRSGNPVAGVKITVIGHLELGQTMTRSDGVFDLAVNGGGAMTLRYTKSGYLEAQRLVASQWNDQKVLDDVVIVGIDSAVSTVVMSAATSQVARGTTMSDADGARRATLIFPPGLSASIVAANGTTTTASALHVRATEFTVGPTGPKSMPASLPSSVAYTYCVDLAADEAVSAGASSVVFSKPVPFYVDNFANLPVGTGVPSASYDTAAAKWVASDNGVVLRIVSITSGAADLDLNGDGIADDASAIGVDAAERQSLGTLYSAGKTLWRIPLRHFTAWDFNFSFMLPGDAASPGQQPPYWIAAPDKCDTCGDQSGNSIVNGFNSTLRESIPIAGTPYTLEYASSRNALTQYSTTIPLTGASVPASLQRVDLTISVAGQLTRVSLPPQANQSYTYTWDGKDGFGRAVAGAREAAITISYVYQPVYGSTAGVSLGTRWGVLVDVQVGEARSGSDTALSQTFRVMLGHFDAGDSALLGGWNFSAQRHYDGNGQTIYDGGGRQRSGDADQTHRALALNRVAGNGLCCFSGDGGPATDAKLGFPYTVAVAPDGTLYIGEFRRIRRVAPDGTISTVTTSVDPQWLAVGPDGALYAAVFSARAVYRVDGNLLTRVAGGGLNNVAHPNGVPATDLSVSPSSIAFGQDGSLYIADSNRVLRVAPDGMATTIYGATTGQSIRPLAVAVAPDGAVYASDEHIVHRIGQDAKHTIFAGSTSSQNGTLLDGAPATSGTLPGIPTGLDVAPDGTVVIALSTGVIFGVAPDGTATRLVGTKTSPHVVQLGGTLARSAAISPYDVKVGPDGSVWLPDQNVDVIYKAANVFPSPVALPPLPSPDGSVAYVFTNGRHTRTVETLTGTTELTLGYDANGGVTSAIDADANTTIIERDPTGTPTAIVAPGGQRTTLTIVSGRLTAVTNPASETIHLDYDSQGLLAHLVDRRSGIHTFTYDANGLLAKDQGPSGGFIAFARSGNARSYTVTATSAEGRSQSYGVQLLGDTTARRDHIAADGTHTQQLFIDATSTSTSPDGSTSSDATTPDLRFGMRAPISDTSTIVAGGHTMRLKHSQTLTTTANPLVIGSLTDTMTINNRNWTTTYDGSTHTAVLVTPQGRTQTSTTDTRGRIISSSQPGIEPASIGYNGFGFVGSVQQGSRTNTFGYDNLRHLTSVTDAIGRTTGFTYDDAERVTTQTLPDSRMIHFTYDANGNVTSVSPPSRPQHQFAFTPENQTSSYTPPSIAANGGATQYAYNLDRQPTSILRPDGKTIAFSYDNGARLGTLTIGRGLYHYDYNNAGQLGQITAPDGGSIALGYSGPLLTSASWTGEVQASISFTYDDDFRIASETVAGDAVTFNYDADSLLTTAGALTLQRDPQNGLLTGSTLASITDQWSYNAFGEPSQYTASANGSSFFDQQFTRDSVGRIQRKVETIAGDTHAFDYLYDDTGRLTGVVRDGNTDATYVYDENSNRVARIAGPMTVVGTYDDQDRLQTYGTNGYQYSANGELTSKTAETGTTNYTYDEIGNLLRVDLPGGTIIEYVIDGANHRIGKKVNGVLVQGFLYSGSLRVAAELDGSGALVSRFVYGTRPNVPDYMIRGGVTYRIIYDHLGSPRLVVDTATGLVMQRIDYDECGNVLYDSLPGFQPFGFAGGLYDADTKLVRFGARDYDPQTGRWTAKDQSLFEGQDTNLYGYALTDAVNFIDREGHQAAQVAEGGGVVLLTGVVAILIYQDLRAHPEAWDVFRPFTESRGKSTSPPGRGCPRPNETYKTKLPSPPPPQPKPVPPPIWLGNELWKKLLDSFADFIDGSGGGMGL